MPFHLHRLALTYSTTRDMQTTGMFDFFRRFPWVLKTQYYENADELLANLARRVIKPAERKVKQLRG